MHGWTFAVAELADIGGFDTGTESVIDEPLPDGVTAVFVIAD